VIIHANLRAKDMLNISATDSSAELLNRLNLGELPRLLQGKGPKVAEANLQFPYRISIRSYAAPFHSADGAVSGAIIVLQDITEEEKLEAMRRDFVANVSHELRTPLTTIKSYTETLLEGALESKETAGKFLTVINEETDRMTRLVRDLLTLSQLEYQSPHWEMRPVLLDELVLDVADKLAGTAQERGLKFKTDFPDEVPSVWGNPDKIEQVLMNVLANAIKYTYPGGDLLVRLQVGEQYVTTHIVDQGPGIPLADQPRIFERFYRVDKARARELGGTGLGLAIAKQIIEVHGGEISLHSEIGVGTEVYFSLPRSRAFSNGHGR
ncbi:MAG: ATP-binding protein, partial [bacterium]|nr:ATP-binding protein [bacterium]